MYITWLGQSCFKIEGEKSTIVTDPYDNSIGLRVPRLQADLVTISHGHHDHNNREAVKGTQGGEPFVIDSPGEYEIEKIFVYGIPSFHDASEGTERGKNVIYRFEIDSLSIAHLGDLGHKLTQEQMEKLEGVDILMVPVGGQYTIDGKQATELVTTLEPRIIIPMHYDISGLKLPKKLDDISVFCKEIGICPKEVLPKYKITKKDLPADDMQVVLLQP